jgi:hypothetical protein
MPYRAMVLVAASLLFATQSYVSAIAQQSAVPQSRRVNVDANKCVQKCRAEQRRAGRPVLRNGECMRQCGL